MSSHLLQGRRNSWLGSPHTHFVQSCSGKFHLHRVWVLQSLTHNSDLANISTQGVSGCLDLQGSNSQDSTSQWEMYCQHLRIDSLLSITFF